jgi:AraC family transcriptional regulator
MNGTNSQGSNRVSGTSPESELEHPFTTHIKLEANSPVPSPFRTPSTFTITRLESTGGLANRITKLSSVPAVLVSVSLKSLPMNSYQLWVADKLVSTPGVLPFRSNVIDFEAEPGCWAGKAFDYVHYTLPRKGLDDIAADLGYGRVSDYRISVVEDDLVLTQITRGILHFIGRNDELSTLALDQFSLVLGAHLIQRYGVLQKPANTSKAGLARWQRERATELLRENLHGKLRLSELARECGLSVSHFARSFKAAFGISTHQWLIQQRIEYAKHLLSQTAMPLVEVAFQAGFSDQAAFTRTFNQIVGASPGRWRREQSSKKKR